MRITTKEKEIALYVFFGILTTLVNLCVYYVFTTYFSVNYLISNSVAWGIAVFFAYITNRKYVFRCQKSSFRKWIRDLTVFVGCRVFSGILEIVLLFICVEILVIGDFISKIGISIFVVIANYVFSKLLVFKQ